jgi:hypothetical protein
MQSFSVQLFRTGFYGASALSLPADLQITPETWSASDRGGCKEATMTAAGSAESLAYLCGWLGHQIEIYNEMGECVWWGDLWDIEVQLDAVSVHLSMDNLYNRIAVTYPHNLPDGTEESLTTDFVEDTISSDRYGKRELINGLPESLSLSATAYRDLLLSRFAQPDPNITTQGGGAGSARLTAQGSWYKASTIYFKNLDGLFEQTNASGTMTIGMYMTSNQITFGAATTPIAAETGEMTIGGGGTFAPLKPKDTITVSGSVVVGDEGKRNNDTYDIEKMDHPYQIGITGEFVSEAPGPTIKISWGDSVSQDNIAQGFQLPTSWTVTHIAIQIKRIGNPTDNFRIGLYPDSGGIPGTVLSAIEIVGSTLYTESTWMEWPLDVPLLLSASTTYYLNMRRTGSPSLTDGYEITIDDEAHYAGGTLRVYNGTTWVAPPTDNPNGTDMPFRLIGEIQSTELLAKALTAASGTGGAFTNTLIFIQSNVMVRQYVEDVRAALDEINEMLDAGTSDGKRLVASVERDRSVVVDVQQEATYPSQNLLFGRDGKLHTATGSLLAPGVLVYGQYVDMESLMLFNSVGIRSPRGPSIYIQESSYDARSDSINLVSEGAITPFDAMKLRQG